MLFGQYIKKRNEEEMRKMKFVLFSLAFTALASFSAFASQKQGWIQENDSWHFYNKGELAEDAWKTNDTGTFHYYLDSDGKMVTSSLIEDGDYLYYVNADGVQSRNKWRLIESEEDKEARWYYFDAKGHAVKEGKKVIDGKTYYFNDYKMLYGWAAVGSDSNAAMVETCEEATMYLGNKDEGYRHDSAWLYVDALHFCESESHNDKDHAWFYFDSKGVKATGKKRVNDKTYYFHDNGVMLENEWDPINKESYFKADGARMENRWFWIKDDDSEAGGHWYYAQKTGKVYKGTSAKIKDKYYLFDANGRMFTGFVASGSDAVHDRAVIDFESTEIMGYENYAYYNKEGAKVTNSKVKLELSDGTFTFGFDKQGKPLNGVVKEYLYKNGILQTAKEEKYELTESGHLVNSSGKVMTGSKYKTDTKEYTKNGNQWTVVSR